MTVQRRTFLTGAALTAGAVLLPRPATATSRGPLRPAAFLRLPPGAVRPQGWLATQLDRQRNGLGGLFPEVSPYLQFDQTGWVHPDLDGWEELPYWLRGYGDLGYVTGDATVLASTERWVEAVLATAAPDGFFGPTVLRTKERGHADLWPHMPILHALRSWAEYHGDTRVDNALTRFFHFMATQPDAVFVDGWGHTRWGDTLDVLFWLYERTGDPALLDLAHRIHRLSADWTGGIPTLHNVNIAQGFREPAQYWQLSGDVAHREAAYRNYDTIMRTYGQFPGGGFAGDENARPGYGDPRQGFETCGIVELMGSHELLTRLTGDPVWADRTEDLAFNSLPAALDPDGRVTHYVTSANVVQLDNVAKTRRQFQNNFAMQAYKPGIRDYRCCPHNYGQGWPYFVEEMWLRTPDGGLAAALYGPSTVTTTVAGSRVTITERTTYPFSDTITFTLTLAQPAAFPLVLRVPGWCQSPLLLVNGRPVAIAGGPRFATVTRTWRNRDTVVLTLPMSTRTQVWDSGAVSVAHGALTFSLGFAEQWRRYAGTEAWPEYEVTSGTAWNYGLTADPRPAVTTGGNVHDPFTVGTAPVRITVDAQRIPDWTADSENVVGTLQGSQVPEKNLNGRRLVLHVSDVDGMAWGSIDEGVPGDAVWLDRSWDGGRTWEGLLGKASVPSTWTGTRTLMYNVSDPRNHRRGLVRACGDANAVGCTEWVYPTVCDVRCDRTSAGQANGDLQPVPATTLSGRVLRLHVDRDGMAWGSIEAGTQGDEVWLDRSWDGGATWPDGSSLGRISVAASTTSARTTMFATRDPRGRHYGGAVRACGRAVTGPNGSCTVWARPAPTRAGAAADALLYSYDPYSGWWPSSWWNSAATLTAVIDHGDQDYDWVIARTFDQNKGVFPAGERGTDPIEGNFASRAIDDSAWWGLAWIEAYDRTGQQRYLAMATTIASYVHQYWDTSTCGGGVWWDRERTYKNAVTSGLYLRLAASVHNRTPGDTLWRQRARTAATWYLGSGMINAANLVNDGLTRDCRNNGQTVWTYNQGLAIGGLVEAWRATGDATLLDTARRLADAALTGLTRDGVLTESCDVGQNTCDDNQKQFKGIFSRYLADLASVTGSAAYRAFAVRQADSIWTRDRDHLNRIGQRWAGGSPNQLDWRTQASGLGALDATQE